MNDDGSRDDGADIDTDDEPVAFPEQFAAAGPPAGEHAAPEGPPPEQLPPEGLPPGGPADQDGYDGYGGYDGYDEDDPYGDEELDGSELLFPSVDEFMTEFLAPILRRRLSRTVAIWCPSWWRHPEAIARVTALWRAFEHLRLDPALGMSTWWLHHADPHLRALMDPDYGPFAVCDPREGHNERELPPLPLEPSPPELWDHPAFSLSAALREEREQAARAAEEEAWQE
jgi:hypothetical protein